MNHQEDKTELDITEAIDRRFYLSREASYFEMHEETKDSQEEKDF